jgi:hypothetical protein
MCDFSPDEQQRLDKTVDDLKQAHDKGSWYRKHQAALRPGLLTEPGSAVTIHAMGEVIGEFNRCEAALFQLRNTHRNCQHITEAIDRLYAFDHELELTRPRGP